MASPAPCRTRTVVDSTGSSLALQDVAQCEQAMTLAAHQPFRRTHGAIGKDAAIARLVDQPQLFERCVENELVATGNVAYAHARRGQRLTPCVGILPREHGRGPGWRVLLRCVMRFDEV